MAKAKRKVRWDALAPPVTRIKRSRPRKPLPKSTRLPAPLDARVEYAGTLCLIRIRGKRAHAWVKQNVAGDQPGQPISPWQWVGDHAFICELRYAVGIARAMRREGFKVDVGQP
jgi:hypothetical protein